MAQLGLNDVEQNNVEQSEELRKTFTKTGQNT